MSIKINARETNLKVGKTPGYYYVMTPELYIALTRDKVIKEAALRSGVSRGVMQACWDAAGEVIKAWATEGHSVAIPGLGTMRFTVRSKAVANVNDVKTSLITHRVHALYRPEGGAGKHQHSDNLLRPQRRNRKACNLIRRWCC